MTNEQATRTANTKALEKLTRAEAILARLYEYVHAAGDEHAIDQCSSFYAHYEYRVLVAVDASKKRLSRNTVQLVECLLSDVEDYAASIGMNVE